MRLSERVPRGTAPNEWTRLRRLLEANGGDVLDLTESNPARVGLAPRGASATLAAPREPVVPYEPDPCGSRVAREAIARRATRRGVPLDPNDIVLVSGTSEGYAHLIRLLTDPGDAILAPRPSYPLIEPIAALEGVRVLPYDLEYDGRWRLDRASLDRAADPRLRATVVIQPNNPTGSCFDSSEMEFLERFAAERGIAILADEVFGEFPWAPRTAPLPTFLGERSVPTFVLDGVSKSCGLPQMKVGWIAIAGPRSARLAAREGLEWIADLFLSVSAPAQAALPTWLEAREEFQTGVHGRLAKNLDRLAALVERRPELSRLVADGGWNAVIRVPSVRSDEDWAVELLRRGVAVHPGHFYDFGAGTYLVVSLLPRPEVFDAGVSILEKFARE